MPSRLTRIDVGGLQVEVERKRVKNLNLRVRPDGSIHASVPGWTTDAQVIGFVSSHREWLEASLERVGRRAGRPRPTYDTGTTVPVWGLPLSVVVAVEPEGRRSSVRREGSLVSLVVGPSGEGPDEAAVAARGRLVGRFLRAELARELPAAARRAELLVGQRASEWRMRTMRTRWGSCSVRRRRIWINVELATRPRECLDYVCLHEACHLLVPNHGPAFYELMDERMPSWRATRALLDEGPHIEWVE
ncbi:MAG: SprT family zinc-dependent metalloprotease [Atopobiaceae bacterium]|jgi:predicted metal-dependent hydrolase|nr:M48 family metallopeptidase [Atopobiaceae bacterium]